MVCILCSLFMTCDNVIYVKMTCDQKDNNVIIHLASGTST